MPVTGTITENNMEDLFDEMLDAQCDELSGDASSEESMQVANVLTRFKEYICSDRFDKKCKQKAGELGIGDHTIVKNRLLHNTLSKIANVFNLAISITAEVIRYAVHFLSKLINLAVNFASTVCHKIINILTLNCGNATA